MASADEIHSNSLIFGALNYFYVCMMMCAVVCVTASFERATKRLEDHLADSPHQMRCLKKIYRELMIMGFISFTIVLIEEMTDLDHTLLVCFEFAHVWMFIVALFYTVNAGFILAMMGRSKSLWIKTDYSDVDMLMEEAAEEDDTGVGKCYNILHCTKLMSRKMLFKLHKLYFLKEYCISNHFDFIKYTQEVVAERVENTLEFRSETWLSCFVLFTIAGFSAQMFGINDGSGASTVARRHLSGVMNATANVTDAPHFVADISLSSAWVVYTMSMVIAIVSYVTLYMLRRECRLAECDLVRHIGDCGVEELPRLLKDMQKEIMLRDKEQSSSDMREMFLHRIQRAKEISNHHTQNAENLTQDRLEFNESRVRAATSAVAWCGGTVNWVWPVAKGGQEILSLEHINFCFFLIELVTLISCFNLAFIVLHVCPIVVPVMAHSGQLSMSAGVLDMIVVITTMLSFVAAPDTASHFGELLGVLYLHGEVVTHIFNYMDQVKQARDNIKENLLREARKMVERSIKEEDSELAKQGVTADILDDPDALRKLGIKMMFHDMDLDGDGELDYREIRAGLFKYGCHVSSKDFKRICRMVDPEQDGNSQLEHWEDFLSMSDEQMLDLEDTLVKEQRAHQLHPNFRAKPKASDAESGDTSHFTTVDLHVDNPMMQSNNLDETDSSDEERS